MIQLHNLTVTFGQESLCLEAISAEFAGVPPNKWVELQLLDLTGGGVIRLGESRSDALGEVRFFSDGLEVEHLTQKHDVALHLIHPSYSEFGTTIYFARFTLFSGWRAILWHLDPRHWRYYFKDALWVNYRQADWS